MVSHSDLLFRNSCDQKHFFRSGIQMWSSSESQHILLRPLLSEQAPPGVLAGAGYVGSFQCQRPLTDVTIDVVAGVVSG